MVQITKENSKTKIERIRNQTIRESCGIQPIKEWMKRRRRQWDKHVTGMDAKILVKISRGNIYLLEKYLQDVRK